jgi:hypothetical protein
MSVNRTLSEDIKLAVGTGEDPAELDALENMYTYGNLGHVVIADATPYTVLAANSGRTHIISEQTSSITINLPTLVAGMEYKFVTGGVATEAQNYVFVATTPSFFNGGVHWADLDSVASNTAVVYGNGSSHLTLTCVIPAVGTVLTFYGLATGEWLVNGTVVSNTTPAFT